MVKRFFDLFILIIFLPIFIILIISIAILIFIFMGNPIFFTQERVGKNNKIFKIIKFRTMKVHISQQDTVDVSRDMQRITKLGYYLRSYKCIQKYNEFQKKYKELIQEINEDSDYDMVHVQYKKTEFSSKDKSWPPKYFLNKKKYSESLTYFNLYNIM